MKLVIKRVLKEWFCNFRVSMAEQLPTINHSSLLMNHQPFFIIERGRNYV